MAFGGSIVGLFGRSPIKPLQDHYRTVHESVAALSGFMQAVITDDWEDAARIQQQIRQLENDADEEKKQFRLNMPNSLFLPMPRTDLLDMISVQDRVANKAKDIAGLMLGREMAIPPQLSDSITDYLDRAIATSAQALTVVNGLDELIETGFGKHASSLIEQMIEELDNIEHETDDQQVTIRATLYQLEKELPPVDVMFLYKIIDWIGELADRAQQVGGYLQMLIAR